MERDAVAGEIDRLTFWSSEGHSVSFRLTDSGFVEIGIGVNRARIMLSDWDMANALVHKCGVRDVYRCDICARAFFHNER